MVEDRARQGTGRRGGVEWSAIKRAKRDPRKITQGTQKQAKQEGSKQHQ